MADPVKILELKEGDWMKGISLQDTFPIGGIFQSSSYNFDPFETMGYLQPALASVQLDSALNKKPHSTISVQSGATGYVFMLADRTAGGANNLFRVKTSDNTVTAYSLTGGNVAGARSFTGLGFLGGELVFIDPANAFVYTVSVGGAGETARGGLSGTGATTIPAKFHTAPDKNLYFTKGSSDGQIAKIDQSATVTDAAFTGDFDLTPKDITDDGTYLIIIMDENPTMVSGINTKCKVYFWDMDKPDADVVLTIPDSYLISARFVDGRLLVIGASGIWQCGIGAAPKLIVPLTSAELPISSQAVTVKGNIMEWATSGSAARVYAYGSKIGKPIWYAPFQSNQSGFLQTTLVASGEYRYVGVDDLASGGKGYVLNSGTTRTNATVQTAPNVLPQPFTFSHAKVVLKSKLTSGQAVDLVLTNSEGINIKASDTQSYSASNPKKTLLFRAKSSQPNAIEFEDIIATINPQGGAIVQRVVVYGVPKHDYSTTI